MQHPPKRQPKRKRTRLVMSLLFAALALAAAFVALLPEIRRAFPAKPPMIKVQQTTYRTLDKRDAAQLESVVIYPDGVNGYQLKMQDGALMLQHNGRNVAIDPTYQTEIVEMLTEISVENTVVEDASEAADQLEAMGLAAPQCKAVARYADGSVETFEVGGMVHDSADYYFRWSGAPGIYTCHSGVLETLTLTENLLIPFEQPVIYGSLVHKLHLSNANGECSIEFADGAYGRLIAPCVYPLPAAAAQSMMNAAENVRLGAYEAQLTDENRSFYGFDQPLCTIEIEQRAGMTSAVGEEGGLTLMEVSAQQQRFVIGRAEGEFFYTCAYEGDVYLISRFLVEMLVNADWRSLITRTPAAMEGSLLSYIVFETPAETIEVHVTHTERVLENNQLETDADGNLVYQTDVTVNGQAAPQELLDELLDRLNSFTVEGSIAAGAVVDTEPRWRITLVTDTGDTRVLEGFRLDVFSDAVSMDGVMQHYVYNGAINVLTTGLV